MTRRKKSNVTVLGACTVLGLTIGILAWVFPRNSPNEPNTNIEIRAEKSSEVQEVAGGNIGHASGSSEDLDGKVVDINIVASDGSRVAKVAGRDIIEIDPVAKEEVKKVNAQLSSAAEIAYRRAVREQEDGVDWFTSGDLEEKKGAALESIEILESLGRLEGVAKSYLMLGAIAKKEGQFDDARKHWKKALKIYADIEFDVMVRRMNERLQALGKKVNASSLEKTE